MGVAVYAFQHSSNRQDGEGSLDAEPDLEGSRAGSAASAGAVLGAPFFQTGRAAIGGAGRIDGSERASGFVFKAPGMLGEAGLTVAERFLVFGLRIHSVGWGPS